MLTFQLISVFLMTKLFFAYDLLYFPAAYARS